MTNWISRHRSLLVILAVLAVTAAGFAALAHLLSEVRYRDVRAAFHAIPTGAIIACVALTAISYLTLTFYDHIALRVVGRPLPWRTAALASFSSYTLSHNLGLSLLTGGSARFRIYSVAGLSPGDISRVIASASLAFWGGVLTLAGIAMVAHPSPLSLGGFSIGMGMQRVAGWLILMSAAGVLLWLGRAGRSLKLMGWSLVLPGRTNALLQIGVACLDLAAASAALLVLLPQAGWSLYPVLFLGYAIAIIVSLLSHVPGGIGIFEAVVVAALPDMDRPRLIAALIAYRALYYLLPLILAIGLIAVHEGRAWRRPIRRAMGLAQILASGIAPIMLAALVSIGGVMLLVSGSLPAIPQRFHALIAILPMPFVQASHLAASIIGTMLILLASGLYRRLDGAFWMTRLLLLAGALFSLLKGIDYEEATVLLVIAGLLQWTRPAFYRHTNFTSATFSPRWLAAMACAVGISIWIGFFAYKHVDYQTDLWWQFGRHHDASSFLRSALATGVIVIGCALWSLMRPVHRMDRKADASSSANPLALSLAERTDACLALTGDKLFLTSASGRAFLMYQIQGQSWIVMGDPVGDPAEWEGLLWQIRERADAAQGRLLLYQLSLDALPLAVDLGLSIVKYGEEARVDLASFTMDGPDGKPLRHAERRAQREGASFEVVPAADVPALIPELRAVSDRWLAAKGHAEKSFSIGRFDAAYMARFDCAVIRVEGRIVAFANIWATQNRNELSVDLMRHDDEDMPYGTMDYLFCQLMLWGKAAGYRWFTLGLAPLSGLEARRLAPLWVKAGAFLYRHGESYYGFEGLRAYKAKFKPRWEPRFIAGPQGLSMARAMMDLQRLVGGGRGSASTRTQRRGLTAVNGGRHD